jgi:hypothetical protein
MSAVELVEIHRRRFASLDEATAARWLVALLAILVLIPVMSVRTAPLADYVNHLGRMEVLATLDGNPLLRRFYDVHWQVIPNLAMDVLVPPLARLLGVELAGRLFLGMTLLLTAGGVFALNRALRGRFSAAPIAVFPFLYNGIFLYGFANYLFAMGLAIWGIAAWVKLREERPVVRLAASSLIVVALFLAHLFGIGLYGLGVLVLELARLKRTWQGGHFWRDGTLVAAQFLPALALMGVSPTLELADQLAWSWPAKAEGIQLALTTYFGDVERPLAWMALGAVLLLLATRRLVLFAEGWLMLAVGGAVFLAMPTVLFGSGFADERMAIALLCLLIACTSLAPAGPGLRAGFLALVLLLTVTRVAGIEAEWLGLSHSYQEMRDALHQVAPGSTILVAEATQPHGDPVKNLALSHAPCLALLDRSSFVSTAFTVSGKQVLTVRPAFNALADRFDGDPPTLAELAHAHAAPDDARPPEFWGHWDSAYDYVFVLYTRGDPNPLPDTLALVHSGNGFQIYRVLKEEDRAEPAVAPTL